MEGGSVKKRIGRDILFFAILVLLLAGLSWTFLPKDNREESGMTRREARESGYLTEPADTVDVLALGDSLTTFGLLPGQLWEDFGISAYTIGGPNQALTKALYCLDRFTQTQHPKIVLLEAFELYQPITQRRVLEDLAFPVVPIFRYHDNWKRPETLQPFAPVRYTVHDPFRGFNHSFEQVKGENVDYMEPAGEAEAVSESCMRYLKKLQARCDELGAELVLFSVPSQYSWNWGRHLGAQAAAEELGIPYLDLNLETQAVPVDWETDSTDGNCHLNYYGGVKVTAYLGAYLTSAGLLTDRRGEPELAFLDDDAEALHRWVREAVLKTEETEAPS